MKVSTLTSGRFLARFAIMLAMLAMTAPGFAQGFKWWHDEGYKRELRLTSEQSARLEEIFQKSSPALRQQKERLDRAQAEFDRLVEQGADDAVMEQVNLLETARGELNKVRVMMLLRMRRTLTADQWAKFTARYERDHGERTRSGGLK